MTENTKADRGWEKLDETARRARVSPMVTGRRRSAALRRIERAEATIAEARAILEELEGAGVPDGPEVPAVSHRLAQVRVTSLPRM